MENEKRSRHVGILSMQRINNYGSYWQARSLKEFIEDFGCKVSFIDIIPGETVVEKAPYRHSFSFRKILRIPAYLKQRLRNKMYQRVRDRDFGCGTTPNYSTDYDSIVIGSDEVFNCAQPSSWGFSEQLFGKMSNDHIITYAASFGYTRLEFLRKNHLDTRIDQALKNVKTISVRDNNSYSIISAITGREALYHLDPVLVNDRIVPKRVFRQKYILIYSYDWRFKDKQFVDAIKAFAKERNLRIYSVGTSQYWCRNKYADVQKWVDYFASAEYVFTDTFHGSIMAIKFHKRFLTIVRESNREKLEDLLARLGLTDRIISQSDMIEEMMNKSIDYDRVEEILNRERGRTMAYLRQEIGE